VQRCLEAGLVEGRTLAVDGTLAPLEQPNVGCRSRTAQSR